MSNNNPNSPLYNPVPLTPDNADRRLSAIENRDDAFIPPTDLTQPRFIGQYDTGSQSSSFQGASEHGSVYPFNDAPGSSTRLDAYRDDPGATDNTPMSPVGTSNEKVEAYAAPRQSSRQKYIVIGGIVVAMIIILAVIIPVYFTVIKPKSRSSSSNGGSDDSQTTANPSASASASATPEEPAIPVSGGNGSVITMEDGTTFVYLNEFGGTWYYDPNDPFNNSARPQSWSPALNEKFRYGEDKIRGVNVGGWLVVEPFMQVDNSPALFERYLTNPVPPVDEWDLSIAMRADTANGGINQMEEHYKTFITEKDFAEIASAGLNYVRIPVGWWMIETRGSEPHLSKVSFTYFLKAIKWCRKYGLRINLDLHAIPGSQNGWNHSGNFGTIGFLNGPMGYANAQRALDIIRIFAEFISQPQYRDVVTMFGIMNEAIGEPMGFDSLSRFYMEAYNIVRRAGGVGEGNGPWISLHDGFFSRTQWPGVFPNADRLSLDTHPYLCFNTQSSNPMSSYETTPCRAWGHMVNNSMSAFGLTNAGEWSNAVTDCGLYLNGVLLGTRYEGTYRDSGSWPRVGDCKTWTDWTRYDRAMKRSIRQFSLASMDALQNYFFWTWKIGDSLESGRVETPAWSYQLGLQEGWMPTDPRDADGVCGNTSPFTPPLRPWQTGGAGAGDIPASVTRALAWPPAVISNVGPISLLPSYTPTGAIPTLTAPPITAGPGEPEITKTVDVGNGWNNPQDTAGLAVEISGCSYLDPWVTPAAAPPTACRL